MHPITIFLCIVPTFSSQAVSAARPSSGVLTKQVAEMHPASIDNPLQVPGESPAYYCSDPSDDLFQIQRLDFIPTNVRIGFYLDVRFIGTFTSPTGDSPWLNITGSINGRQELSPLYNSLLCDIDVFQEIPVPTDDPDHPPRLHRACPPGIQKGYAVVKSPPMPLSPQEVVEGLYDLRAEATTKDGRRIFCVQGSFNVTT